MKSVLPSSVTVQLHRALAARPLQKRRALRLRQVVAISGSQRDRGGHRGHGEAAVDPVGPGAAETERTRQKFLPGISALVGTALVLVVLAV